MKIVIAGLGIIGGSLAKALKKYTDHTIYGMNRSTESLQKALACGAIDDVADQNTLKSADMLILGMYPEAAVLPPFLSSPPASDTYPPASHTPPEFLRSHGSSSESPVPSK